MSSSVQRLSNIVNHFYGNSTKTCANSRVPVQNLCNVSSTESQVTEERKAGQSVSDLNTVKEKERFSYQNVEPVPNESWSQETLDLYNQLQKLVEESNGLWEKCKTPSYNLRKYHPFSFCVDGDGKKLFEIFMFLNKTERRSKFVCQFGPSTMGPKGYIHVGATAAMMDFATALVVNRCGYRSPMTANLSVDFKQPIPVDSTVLYEANIESVQGRKVYSYAEMKSHDGKQLYGTVKGLFVTAK